MWRLIGILALHLADTRDDAVMAEGPRPKGISELFLGKHDCSSSGRWIEASHNHTNSRKIFSGRAVILLQSSIETCSIPVEAGPPSCDIPSRSSLQAKVTHVVPGSQQLERRPGMEAVVKQS